MSHDGTGAIPPYQPAGASPGATPGTLTCPKCGGVMRTYDRNGIHLEQCQTCRGIFLDFGELEHLTQLEARMTAPPQPAAPKPRRRATAMATTAPGGVTAATTATARAASRGCSSPADPIGSRYCAPLCGARYTSNRWPAPENHWPEGHPARHPRREPHDCGPITKEDDMTDVIDQCAIPSSHRSSARVPSAVLPPRSTPTSPHR